MGQPHLLTILTFLPLAGVLSLLTLSAEDHEWIRRLALVTAIAEFIFSLRLVQLFEVNFPGYQFVEFHQWITSPRINYHLGIDGISLFLIVLTTFLTPIGILASWGSIQKNVKGFFIALLVLETGVIGVFVSLDLFLFFLFWEVMLIPMYLLIGIWGHERRIYAAMKFILYTMFGSILMLVAIVVALRADGLLRSAVKSKACSFTAKSCFPAARKCCSSARFSWRLRSRCRSSRCTLGCPTRTPKRPRPAP